MGYNFPSVTDGDISFGPGILTMGAAGTTPTADIGGITEDGIKFETVSETRNIRQGNPKMIAYSFSQAQGVMVKATGIEWDFTTFAQVLGAGTTTSTGTEDTLVFGGDPLVRRYAIQVQHAMAQSGHTMYARVWRAAGQGGLNIPFQHDEHQFEYTWEGHRTTTDWAGNALACGAQLWALYRDKN